MNKTFLASALAVFATAAVMTTAVSADETVTESEVQPCQYQEGQGYRHGGGDSEFKGLITREVEQIENGIVMTMTTDDEDALADLLARHEEMEENRPEDDAVNHEVEYLDNGIKVTITTDDED